MPTVCFANSKGGAGKSTTTLIIGQVLAEAGKKVAILDADPNQPLASWAERTGDSIPDELKIIAGVTEKNLLDIQEVEAEESDFVLIDLEGTASIAVSYSSEMIPLYDENGVLGQLATHNLNTNLKILDESQLEGDFPLTVI